MLVLVHEEVRYYQISTQNKTHFFVVVENEWINISDNGERSRFVVDLHRFSCWSSLCYSRTETESCIEYIFCPRISIHFAPLNAAHKYCKLKKRKRVAAGTCTSHLVLLFHDTAALHRCFIYYFRNRAIETNEQHNKIRLTFLAMTLNFTACFPFTSPPFDVSNTQIICKNSQSMNMISQVSGQSVSRWILIDCEHKRERERARSCPIDCPWILWYGVFELFRHQHRIEYVRMLWHTNHCMYIMFIMETKLQKINRMQYWRMTTYH